MIGLESNIGIIHFVGIGGIGMSGVAEIMHNLGYQVQGSDMAANAVVQHLRDKGIPIFIGQKAENIEQAAVLVTSTAIKRDNPEVVHALERRIPVVRRAEMLAELMRLKKCVAIAGTHGKTTTTSMVSALLDKGGFDPTVVNGGIINQYGSNARLGHSEWMVVEADESDGSFLRLGGVVSVVTNIDPEHLEHYGSFERVKDAFVEFIEKVPFYGAAILCIDHPEVQAILPRITDRRTLTYGFSPQADVRGENITPIPGGSRFDVVLQLKHGTLVHIKNVTLPMPGRHNVQNALAAIAVAAMLDMSPDDIKKGLAAFAGVKRRFTHVGDVDGTQIIDDYGHHPVEIRSTLAAAREGVTGRLIAVVQPHRYTRLKDLFSAFQTCFNDADSVILTPVYSAGEAPIDGFNSDTLAQGLKHAGHRHVLNVATPEQLAQTLSGMIQKGDMVVCLGAGDITRWASGLADRIKEIRKGGSA